MQPGYIALIFWSLSIFAVWGILNALRTGVAHGEVFSYRIDRNPISFAFAVLGDASVIVLAMAETLHAFGLAGDPFAMIRGVLPAFLAYPT